MAVTQMAVVAVCLLGACGDTNESASNAPRAAGVERLGAKVATFERWPERRQLSHAEHLHAGDVAQATSPVFRVTDVLPRRDGGVYVANSGTHEILALDAEGNLRWRSGGEGEGPGEFRALTGLQEWPGDTLLALDGGGSAASFWTTSGEHVRTRSMRPVAAEPDESLLLSVGGSLVGVLADGRMVVRGPQRAFGAGEPGLRRVRTDMTIVDSGGERRVPVELPGPWVYELASPGPMPALLAPMSGGTDVALGRRARTMVWARADAFEVVVLNPDGRARAVYGVDEPRTPVSPSVRRAYLEQWTPWFEVDEEVPFPSDVPAFDDVFVATDGDIWARRFHWGNAAEQWVRIEGPPSSASIDRYLFPDKVEVLGATNDWVYAVRRDELNVENVVRFDLEAR